MCCPKIIFADYERFFGQSHVFLEAMIKLAIGSDSLPEIFSDTPVTHLGGAAVVDFRHVMQIISEGGGTPALRAYLRFVNLVLNDKRDNS
jgi:hypothetical protein